LAALSQSADSCWALSGLKIGGTDITKPLSFPPEPPSRRRAPALRLSARFQPIAASTVSSIAAMAISPSSRTLKSPQSREDFLTRSAKGGIWCRFLP
jgi:hypothetical protein